jgi:hypothetical protein
VFEFVVVVDRGVLCSPRFHGVVTLVSDCASPLVSSDSVHKIPGLLWSP